MEVPSIQQPMPDNWLATTEASFQADVLDAAGPVLVEFTATWATTPGSHPGDLSTAFLGHDSGVVIAAVDVDASPALAAEYAIRGVPTFILFNSGKRIDMRVGAMDIEAVQAWLDNHLSHAA